MKGAIAYGLAVVILISGSVWAWFAGPCALYTFASAGDTPARCLMK